MTGTWAIKRKAIGNSTYPALRSGRNQKAKAEPSLWMCLAAASLVLGIVTLSSVLTGPSAGEALVAIRVTQQELLLAQRLIRDPVLHEAESLLALARSSLKDRRYEETLVAARNAYERVANVSR
jgi:hypothetical protein